MLGEMTPVNTLMAGMRVEMIVPVKDDQKVAKRVDLMGHGMALKIHLT